MTKNGDKVGIMITYYAENDDLNLENVEVSVEGFDMSNSKIYLVDDVNSMSPYLKGTFENNKLTLVLKRNSIIYIEK